MKRIVSTAIALALGLAFAGGAHADDKKKLYFVVNVPSDFWKAAEAGVSERTARAKIGTSTRIGLTKDAHRALRFYLKESRFVSGPGTLNR